MAGIIHEMTRTIIDSVMQQLREQISQLRKESHMEALSVPEEREETYTHTPRCEGIMSRMQVSKAIMRRRRDVRRSQLPNKMLWQLYEDRWMPSPRKLLDRPDEGRILNWQG
ncbi:hypothetical protein LIER_06395 [Lithospermum erythrorhizon]|uniref:Uncharacterized protein n=1 Tax=Lithospermum erythrorhizon TaxID=34254 RepID=A0AAV3P5G7_LITER